MQLKGIGVDLVRLARIRQMIQMHGAKDCRRILNSREQKQWKSSGWNQKFFARLFAAKEAYFKAIGGNWMALEGFADFEVVRQEGHQFTIQNNKAVKNPDYVTGQFFDNEKWAGAQVVIWQ